MTWTVTKGSLWNCTRDSEMSFWHRAIIWRKRETSLEFSVSLKFFFQVGLKFLNFSWLLFNLSLQLINSIVVLISSSWFDILELFESQSVFSVHCSKFQKASLEVMKLNLNWSEFISCKVASLSNTPQSLNFWFDEVAAVGSASCDPFQAIGVVAQLSVLLANFIGLWNVLLMFIFRVLTFLDIIDSFVWISDFIESIKLFFIDGIFKWNFWNY